MLLERNGKLTMWKSKSSRLSYSLVESLPPKVIFTKLMSFMGNYLKYLLKLKSCKQVISCCHVNQLTRECLARKHDQSGNVFLLFSFDIELFQVRLW